MPQPTLNYDDLMLWIIAHQRDLLAALAASTWLAADRQMVIDNSLRVLASRLARVGVNLVSDPAKWASLSAPPIAPE